jgi:hypothetical protein
LLFASHYLGEREKIKEEREREWIRVALRVRKISNIEMK